MNNLFILIYFKLLRKKYNKIGNPANHFYKPHGPLSGRDPQVENPCSNVLIYLSLLRKSINTMNQPYATPALKVRLLLYLLIVMYLRSVYVLALKISRL